MPFQVFQPLCLYGQNWSPGFVYARQGLPYILPVCRSAFTSLYRGPLDGERCFSEAERSLVSIFLFCLATLCDYFVLAHLASCQFRPAIGKSYRLCHALSHSWPHVGLELTD